MVFPASLKAQQYGLEVEVVAENIGPLIGPLGLTDLTGYSCTRVYVTMQHEDDFLSSVSGDAVNPTYVNTTTSFYQAVLGAATPNDINSLLFAVYPDLAYDSWVTIGLEGVPNAAVGEAAVATEESPDQPWTTNFDPGGGLPGGNIVMNNDLPGAWYALNGDTNGVAGGNLRVLAGQFTTTGILFGQLYVQVFIHGDGSNEFRSSFELSNTNPGCMAPEACNFSELAFPDDGSCIVPPNGGDCCPAGLFISEFSEGIGYDTYVELFNASQDTVLLDGFVMARTANQLNPEGGFDFFDIVFPEGATVPPGGTYVIAESGANTLITGAADLLVPEVSSGDDALGLINPAGVIVDQIGVPGTDEGNGWTIDGVDDATYNGTIIRLPHVHDGNGGDWSSSTNDWDIIEGWIGGIGEHDINGNCFGASDFLVRGCANPEAMNFDSTATANAMAMCAFPGCTFEAACNFDPIATVDDGTCDYSCIGCTDSTACNHTPQFTIEDGSCDYSCIGCTDSTACNHAIEFTIDDGSCDYSCLGCTDVFACNYSPEVTIDNGSCEFESCLGCTDPDGCNFDAGALYDDGSCEFSTCQGCTDPDACNYDDEALYDSGACEYETCYGCLDDAACNFNVTATYSDGSCEYTSCIGCTDPVALNFDPQATGDDGSCVYPELGCMDEAACNYSPFATSDDGTCEYPDVVGICGGGCEEDADEDGTCDTEDDCIGPNDAIGVCNGDCLADADGDGICDDVDDCIGAIDALGVCNGGCPADVNGNSICDDIDAQLCGENTLWDPLLGQCFGDGSSFCPTDLDGNGETGAGDLLIFLAAFDADCQLESSQFQCGDSLVYGGYSYGTVAIGGQCWFNENLRSAEFNSGYSIPFVLEDWQWQDATFPARCYLNNDEQWFSWFGYLYNWHAISNPGGLCPSGWKVPSDSDWLDLEIELGLSEEEHDILYDFRGQSSQIGTQLKTTFPYSGWSGANTVGFNGLPGGTRQGYSGGFYGVGDFGFWWTSSLSSSSSAYTRHLSVWENGIEVNSSQLSQGHYVRCMLDED